VTDPVSRPVRSSTAPARVQRAFTWLHDVADRGWTASAVLAYGVLQNFFVPGLSDALFLPLALAQPRRAYRLALAAAIGSLVGASLLYWVGANALSVLTETIGRFVGVTDDGLTTAQAMLADYGWLLVIGSAFSPLSTKLITASAGAFGMPYPLFLAAYGAARCVRVFGFAWAVRTFGAKAVREAFGLVVDDADELASPITAVDSLDTPAPIHRVPPR
jgi:membrane protein YqaA with SNARE-associated domain